MSDAQNRIDDDWPVSWDAAGRDQFRTMANSTPAQRLAWLEAALRLAESSGALARCDTPERRRRRGLGPFRPA